jgi:L-ascorbate metabolism protein UlaG (beta-lactamase superfamily)
MELIKYTHACVRLESDGRSLLVDPGIWAEDAAFEGATDVLITHEHFDHLDTDRLAKRGDLRIHAPAPVVEKLAEAGVIASTVTAGDEFDAAGFTVRAVGGLHAEIYDGLPGCANIGYVIEGSLYHPGDSLFVPDAAVETLLVPISAPWLKLAEAIDFVRAISPARAFPIHDAMLSDKGLAGTDNWLRMKGETDYARITVGDSVTL